MKTKIRTFFSTQKVLALTGLLCLVALSLAGPLEAQTLTQGYGADESLQRGMIVRLKQEDASKVESLTIESIEKMHGVVVDANDAPVTLSAEGQKVFIATVGRFDTLVSSQGGEINPGDYITISALRGVGMKAGTKEPVVVGRAITGFNGRDGVISKAEFKNGDNTQSVSISRIQVDIGVARNPLLKAAEPNLPEFLKRAAESLAGKPVSPAKAYISAVIFVLSTIIAATLMYGGIRSAITSIGRNPLSKKSIIRGMLQVIITGLIIFISGIFGVYLLLKL
jgi:hypothetical protein